MSDSTSSFTPAALWHLLATLAIGGVGAAVFLYFSLPLPWMLGSLTATLASSFLGFNPRIPMWLFLTMLVWLGIYAGAALDPSLLAGILQWPLTLLGLIVLVVLTSLLNARYFQRYAGFDRPTALLASVPGAQTLALIMCARYGGDERKVLIPQITRVLAVIYFVPLLLVMFGDWAGLDIDRVRGNPSEPWELPEWPVMLLVAGAAGAGILLAKKLRWPQHTLLGPLFMVALLQVTGVTELSVPGQALVPVQFVLGAFLGSRFARVQWRSALKVSLHGMVALVLTFVMVFVMTLLLTLVTDVPPAAIFLGFAPGGLPEMVLISAALNVDPAFVVFHHLTRFILIAACMPWVLSRLAPPSEASKDP